MVCPIAVHRNVRHRHRRCEKCGRRVRFNFIFCGLSFRVVGKMAKIQQFNWTFLLENVEERMFYECSSNQTEYESSLGPHRRQCWLLLYSHRCTLVWCHFGPLHWDRNNSFHWIIGTICATLFDSEIYNFYKLFRYFAVLFSCIFSEMDLWDATVSCRVYASAQLLTVRRPTCSLIMCVFCRCHRRCYRANTLLQLLRDTHGKRTGQRKRNFLLFEFVLYRFCLYTVASARTAHTRRSISTNAE